MAFGPDNFNATVALKSVFCFQGDDIDDVFDEDSEPYLWVIMVKIDAEGLSQNGNYLTGEAKYFLSPGSHGNIGGSIADGQTRNIPAEVGTWETSLKPIPISVAGQQLTTIPGVILCCAVLLEENLTPDDAVEAGHQALNDLVKTTVANTIASLGLAGVAADAAAEVALAASQGQTVTLAAAAQDVLKKRLKPIQDLFTVAAPGDLVTTILGNLNLAGYLGTAIDRDKPMGVFVQTFNQADLAASFESTPGLPSAYGRIAIDSHLWNMPDWAYTLHGEAYAHHKFVRIAPPTSARLQVTCTSKRSLPTGKRVAAIGGVDNNAFWSFGRSAAADRIRSGQNTFFVAQPGGQEVEVVAVQGGYSHGEPWYFVQTAADQNPVNNLLNLPDCTGATTIEVWY